MNLAKSIHDIAMEFSVLAGVASAKGMPKESKEAYLLAYFLEKNAVKKLHSSDKDSRFILLRSAAALAYKADLFEESKILIKQCKSENPPSWIIAELAEIANLVKKEQQSKTSNKELQFEGIFTDINSEENKITIQKVGEKESIAVIIPSNLLIEIVKKYWTKKVHIKARRNINGLVVLEKIKIAA